MFSGIVETVGTVTRREPLDGAVRFEISAAAIGADVQPGDSVAVDGACLTVESVSDSHFTVTAVATTLERTIAKAYEIGTRVNLERALRVGDRLDGHFVQGHVDGVGEVVGVEHEGADVKLHCDVPPDVARTTLAKGSVTLNGVSLTVADGPGGDSGSRVTIAVIPFTLAHTNLSGLVAGDAVNVEADLIGKYVGRMVALGPNHATPSASEQGH